MALFFLCASILVLAQNRTMQREREPVKAYGSKSAPITMEVYMDFQCRACRSLYEETLRPLINDYVASGKVYLIHRDFPMLQHAMEAARWANAAARLGKFPEVEAALYDNQVSWSADGNIRKYVAAVLSPTEMEHVQMMVEACHANASVKPAKMMRLLAQESNRGCVLDSDIEKDMALGHQIPVKGVPTSIVTYEGREFRFVGPYIGTKYHPRDWKLFFDLLLRH